MRANNIIPILLECCSFDAKNPCKFHIILTIKLFNVHFVTRLLYLPNVFSCHKHQLYEKFLL